MTSKIIVYSKDYCPYCVRAKNLLIAKKLQFTEIDITNERYQITVTIDTKRRSRGNKIIRNILT
jgi:glutaredoxin